MPTNQTQLTTQNQPSRLAMVDIIRVMLAILMISYHSWIQLSQKITGEDLSAGYIAVEAFFIMSGFFLAKSAYKQDAPTWYRYTWRKLWAYLPLLIITVLFGVVSLGASSLIYMNVHTQPLVNVFGCSWFMWFLFICGAFIFPITKHTKQKFMIPALVIGIGCYVGLYFLNHTIPYFNTSDPFWKLSVYGFTTAFLRGTGGLFLGTFIYGCYTKLKDKNIPLVVQITLSIIAILAGLASIFVMFIYTRTAWDFAVVGLFFIFFFVLLTNIGAISKRVVLPNNVCKNMGQITFVVYICHWVVIGFMGVFGKHDPTLLDQSWFLALYGIICYAGSIGLAIAVEAINRVLKKKLLCKCKRLNSI